MRQPSKLKIKSNPKKSVHGENDAIMEKIRKVQTQINKYKAFKANIPMSVSSLNN